MKKRFFLSLLLCLTTGLFLLSATATADSKTCSVTFFVDGESKNVIYVEYEPDSILNPGIIPAESAYTPELADDACFTGWYLADGTKFEFGSTVVTEDIKVSAEFKPEHGAFEETTVPSTCEEAGKIIRTCPDCGYRIEETLEKAPHDLTEVAEVPSTCKDRGTAKHYLCNVCGGLFLDRDGETETDEEDLALPLAGHQCDFVKGEESTCQKKGTADHWECTVCGKLFPDVEGVPGLEPTDLKALELEDYAAHKLTYSPGKKSTCTEWGLSEHWKCSVCGKIFSDESGETDVTADSQTRLPLAKHEVVLVHEVPATCAAPGTAEHYACKNCHAMFSDALGKQPVTEAELELPISTTHTLTPVSAIAADCTHTGKAAHYICTLCRKLFWNSDGTQEAADAELETAALGHELVKNEAVEPTCTRDGNFEYYRCSRCGACFLDADGTVSTTESGTIRPATHHIPGMSQVPGVPYSCTTDGVMMHYSCSVCGKNFEDKAGTKELKSVIIPKHHTLYLTEKKEATCTEKGHIAYYSCSECGKYFRDASGLEEIQTEEIATPLANHDFRNGVCTVCGKEEASFKAQIIKGNGGTASYGYEYSFTLNTDYETVKDGLLVRVDGQKIAASSFSVSKGSTVVTLTADYIKSLTPGAYDISFETAQGTASGTFKVSRSPKTGDESNPALWAAVGLMSAAAVAGIGVYLGRRKKK